MLGYLMVIFTHIYIYSFLLLHTKTPSASDPPSSDPPFSPLPRDSGSLRRGGAFLTISSTSFFLHNPSLPSLPNHPSALPSLFSFVSTFPSESGEGGLLQRRRVKRRRGLPFPFKLFSFVFLCFLFVSLCSSCKSGEFSGELTVVLAD